MKEVCQECAGYSPYLTDISEADKPWDKHRRISEVIQEYYELTGMLKYGLRVSKCSRELMFVFEASSEGELRLRLRQARFCRVRHCSICQWRRRLVWYARLINALPNVLRDHSKARWVFLTLTVPNCPLTELRATVEEMNKAWGRLSKRKEFPAIGFIRSLEVTAAYDIYDGSRYLGRHGKTYAVNWEKKHPGRKLRLEPTLDAHPHFHALMMVRPSYFSTGYIPQENWRELWGSCLKVSYLPIVNVQTIKGKPGEDSLTKAILETVKYCVKEDDLISSPEWLKEITIQLHKTRAVNVGGLLKDYLRSDEPEDLINTDENEKIEEMTEEEHKIYFDWMEQFRRYKMRNS